MYRRTFIATAAAFAAAPALAASGTPYSKGLVKKELAAGKTVVVDFYTDWCVTCRAQQKTLAALKSEFPEYEEKITFISVPWDKYSNGELSRSLNIPRRSTLVALKDDKEIGRIVAGTTRGQIKKLLDAALGAATA